MEFCRAVAHSYREVRGAPYVQAGAWVVKLVCRNCDLERTDYVSLHNGRRTRSPVYKYAEGYLQSPGSRRITKDKARMAWLSSRRTSAWRKRA